MKPFRQIELVLFLVLAVSAFLYGQGPSILLEKAIYTEETLGNLNDAIALYQQAITSADATRETSAIALFRLGMCHQKSGDAKQAKAAFEKLSKAYPEQQDLIAKIPATSVNILELRPAPWADGEVLLLSIKAKNGRQSGKLFYKFESAADSGKKAWKMQSMQVGSALQYTSALIDGASFIPISSIVKEDPTYREYQTSYGAQQIERVQRIIGGASTNKVFPLIRTTYDDQELIQILRCLPLKEGFQLTIPVFSSNSNEALADVKIEVTAKERITTPAGTFDCYKTVLTRGNQSQSSTYWISADSHSYIVKATENRFFAGTEPAPVDMELNLIGIAGKDQSVHFENSALGIALDTPSGWFIDDFELNSAKVLKVIGPEIEANGQLNFTNLPNSWPTGEWLRQEAASYIAKMQDWYQTFTVRPENSVVSTVSGTAAIRYTVDFMFRGSNRVQYIFYFATPARRYILKFETAKEEFERLRPVFDSIASSLRAQ